MSTHEPITYSGAGYDQVMKTLIDANPILAAKALQIARLAPAETEAAIIWQLKAWNGSTVLPEVVEQTLRALVTYFQGKELS